MSVSALTAFWAVSVLLILVPGADWAFAISAGLRDRSVVPAVGGLLLGYVGLTAVVAAGVAAVVAQHPVLLTGITVLGAAYLLYLGVTTLARPGELPSAAATEAGGSGGDGAGWGARLAKGAGVSGLNPKAMLLFVALLPQFTDPDGSWPTAAQIGALGLVHTLSCAGIYLAVSLLARTVLGARPTAARVVTRLSGVAMLAIGALLLVENLLK